MNRPGDIVWATCDVVLALGGRLTYSPKCGTEKRRPWLMLGVAGDVEVWTGLSTVPHADGIEIPRAAALRLRPGTHALPHCVTLLPANAFQGHEVQGHLYEGAIPVGLLIGASQAIRAAG